MRVFRRKYTDSEGNTQTASKWYVEFTDHAGVKHSMAGFTDKAATEALGRRLGRLVSLLAVGEPPDVALMKWLDGLPRRILDNLARWDMVSPRRAGGARTLSEHVEQWKGALLAKGDSERHVKQQAGRVLRICEGCGFRLPRDLDGGTVGAWLHKQVEQGAFGLATRNHYLTALRTFCGWMVREGRLAADPTKHLSRRNTAPDIRRQRRALSAEECRRLLEATAEAGRHHGMSGQERALLYRVALETGLRHSELRSLTVGDLELAAEPSTVRVEAAYTKSGREDVLPLRQDTAALLERHTARRLPAAPVFNMWRGKGAPMLRRDLRAAGISYENDKGEYVDFHALRHTFITALANSGVHPKTAQALARHSSITLTMDRYTHSLLEGQAEAVAKLPDLTPAEREKAAATGTDSLLALLPVSDGQQADNTGQYGTNDKCSGENAKKPDKAHRGRSRASKDGEGGGNRTHDLRIKSPLLCLTELRPHPPIGMVSIVQPPPAIKQQASRAAPAGFTCRCRREMTGVWIDRI